MSCASNAWAVTLWSIMQMLCRLGPVTVHVLHGDTVLVQFVVGVANRGRHLSVGCKGVLVSVLVTLLVCRLGPRCHSNGLFDLGQYAAFSEDLWDAGHADDEKAAGHFCRGPKDKWSNVVDAVF